MILSDSLIEEIYQTLIKLPYASVVSLINKMQAEIAQQHRHQDEINRDIQLDARRQVNNAGTD